MVTPYSYPKHLHVQGHTIEDIPCAVLQHYGPSSIWHSVHTEALPIPAPLRGEDLGVGISLAHDTLDLVPQI